MVSIYWKITYLDTEVFMLAQDSRLKEQDNFQICLEIYMRFCVIIQICVGIWGKIKWKVCCGDLVSFFFIVAKILET